MTGRKIRWHRYSDHRGRTISVRATQDHEGRWIEEWSVEQIMAVDLSNEPDNPNHDREGAYDG